MRKLVNLVFVLSLMAILFACEKVEDKPNENKPNKDNPSKVNYLKPNANIRGQTNCTQKARINILR